MTHPDRYNESEGMAAASFGGERGGFDPAPEIGGAMKQIKSTVRTGVVAMLGNKYWGVLYEDGQCTEIGWTEDIEKAKISDPRYCKKPTDMTWRPRDGRFNSDFDALLNAKLVLIGVTTLYSIDEAAL